MTSDILASNFFELFNLPVAYDIDLNKVQQHYRELQKAIHPDRFANASDQERRLSMQQTSWVNEAFQTLRNPIERAIYMLKLKDVDMNFENETTMDAEFLMQQMELREALEEIESKDDPLAELDIMSDSIKRHMEEYVTEFVDVYQKDDIDQAKECIRKLQFLQKAQSQVDGITAKIEDELI